MPSTPYSERGRWHPMTIGLRLKLLALSLPLCPFLVLGPIVFLMQFPRLGIPGPIMYVVVFGSMAVGLSATPLLARALLVRNNPAAARLSALWLAGGAVMGGLLAPALASAVAPSAVQAIGEGFVALGLALVGILLASFHEE